MSIDVDQAALGPKGVDGPLIENAGITDSRSTGRLKRREPFSFLAVQPRFFVNGGLGMIGGAAGLVGLYPGFSTSRFLGA